MPALRKAVPALIRKRLRTVAKLNAAALESGRQRDLHALRVAVKRLRYNLEFFAVLLGPHGDEALIVLGRLQERLGTISDAGSFSRTCAAMLARLGPDDPRRPGLLGRIEAARTGRRQALAALRSGLARKGEAAYPERLAAAISAALGSLSPKPAE
jgi:CHAD domain-containing protein